MEAASFFEKRILIVAGHYGSGKTEFAMSLAFAAAAEVLLPLSVVDLDVVNPYFRSRELASGLAAVGVEVSGSFYGHEVTAELPELSAAVRKPLEDENCRVIVDLGGNDAGARIVKQFAKYFNAENSSLALIVNANRFETQNEAAAAEHIVAIENELQRKADFLINNTHLIRETTAEDIYKGHRLCAALAEKRNIKLLCDCYPRDLIDPAVLDKDHSDLRLFGVGMYMRQSWLDR